MTRDFIMITGAAGMVGSHLIESYAKTLPAEQILGTWFNPTIDWEEVAPLCQSVELDVTDPKRVYEVINRYRPYIIYHLAAQSYPAVSWERPAETIRINVIGTVHVFEAIRQIRHSDNRYDPMVVVACSSAEYGASLTEENAPIRETAPLLPLHPYGVSKVGQDLLAYQYWINEGIRCVRVRIFNTTGARKRNDVTSDFVSRAYAIARNAPNEFRVGNLQSRRAITDVRDLVTALQLLAEKGEPGEVYNVSGEKVYRIGDLIPLIERELSISLKVVVDPTLLRPSDEPLIVGNSDRLKACTGWQQQYTLEETIADMVAYLKRKHR